MNLKIRPYRPVGLLSALFATAIVSFAGFSVAQNPPSDTAASKPVPLVTQLRKTVAFITVKYRNGDKVWKAQGTCFFISVRDGRLGKDGGFAYLVTNRHVAAPAGKDGKAFPVLSTSLRLNLRHPEKDRGSEDETIPLGQGTLKWYFSTDAGVDVAVLPIIPNPAKYDFVIIPTDFFATKDVLASNTVTEGDRVLFAGFFYQFPGKFKAQPIIREGILAMLPDEDLPGTLGKPAKAYLADVHVFGGNSGAPVFVNLGGLRAGVISAGERYLLLGIVCGYFYEDEDFTLRVATTLKGKAEANSGISVIVPIDEVKAVLDDAALKSAREAIADPGGYRALYKGLSLDDFRRSVSLFVSKLRTFDDELTTAIDAVILNGDSTQRSNKLKALFQQYNTRFSSEFRNEGLAIRDEIKNRVPNAPNEAAAATHYDALDTGMLAGAHPIKEVADDLEGLMGMLSQAIAAHANK